MRQPQHSPECNRYRLPAVPAQKRGKSMAGYRAYGYDNHRKLGELHQRVRQENKRKALGYVHEYRQVACLLPPGTEHVSRTGIAVAVAGDVFIEQPAADDDGKRDRAEEKSR